MSKKLPVIAIVGRTNVGKSSLFNSLVGQRRAIVKDTPGVTRDRCYAFVTRHGAPLTFVDTGGFVGEDDGEMTNLVRSQVELAIDEADIILAVLDGLYGPHPLDQEVVQRLRESRKETIFIVNKCEKESTAQAATEFFQFGIDDYKTISAAHNQGINELVDEIKTRLKQKGMLSEDKQQDDDLIAVAVLGRPNVGKSTLVNKLLGEERVITSDVPGTTRDSIDNLLTRDGQSYLLVDTAGLRKKAKIHDLSVERYSALRTMKSLARCDVAILMIDATRGQPSEQDLKIAGLIHERGRPFVVVVNKWDDVEKDHKSAKEYTDALRDSIKFARYAPVIFVSALTGKRCPSILNKAKEIYETAQKRIQTGELNRILTRAIERRPPPVFRGAPIKLFFATQPSVAPPTFILFFNHPEKINFSYQRYLKNSIRKHFPFEGSDIKLELRKRTEKQNRLKQA